MSESADPAGPVDCRVSRQTVVSYGAGTNSTAMVAEMVRRGEPIAAVVFADTGGERAETYAHVIEFSEWLTARGYPAITTVRQTTKVGDVAVMTLEAECLQERALAMEANADLTAIKGLGRGFAWRDLIRADAAQCKFDFEQRMETPCGCFDG